MENQNSSSHIKWRNNNVFENHGSSKGRRNNDFFERRNEPIVPKTEEFVTSSDVDEEMPPFKGGSHEEEDVPLGDHEETKISEWKKLVSIPEKEKSEEKGECVLGKKESGELIEGKQIEEKNGVNENKSENKSDLCEESNLLVPLYNEGYCFTNTLNSSVSSVISLSDLRRSIPGKEDAMNECSQ